MVTFVVIWLILGTAATMYDIIESGCVKYNDLPRVIIGIIGGGLTAAIIVLTLIIEFYEQHGNDYIWTNKKK